MEDPSLTTRDRSLPWGQHFRAIRGRTHYRATTRGGPPPPFHTPPPWSGLGFWGSCQEAYAHNATEARRLKANQSFDFRAKNPLSSGLDGEWVALPWLGSDSN